MYLIYIYMIIYFSLPYQDCSALSFILDHLLLQAPLDTGVNDKDCPALTKVYIVQRLAYIKYMYR